MSTIKWMAAMAVAALSLSAQAEPLHIYTDLTANVTAINNTFYELDNGLQPGMPIGVSFDTEDSFSPANVHGNVLTSQPTQYFWNLGLSSSGHSLGFAETYFGPPITQFRLEDDVRNASGDLVDVFEFNVGASLGINLTYTLKERLEFAATTFDGLDEWSILSLANAPLLSGTLHVHRVAEGWDATFSISDLDADVTSFAARFEGPGAQIPCIPEPGQYALLLAGLAGASAWRRRAM